MHEFRINMIKSQLQAKDVKELIQIWKERVSGKHNSNTIEAARRVLKERGEKIEHIPPE